MDSSGAAKASGDLTAPEGSSDRTTALVPGRDVSPTLPRIVRADPPAPEPPAPVEETTVWIAAAARPAQDENEQDEKAEQDAPTAEHAPTAARVAMRLLLLALAFVLGYLLGRYS